MPTRLSAHVARCVVSFALLSGLAAPALALEVKTVPYVRGMAPKDALAQLEAEGFKDFLLELDGVEKTRAEIEAAPVATGWTVPSHGTSADTTAVLEVGFETYVSVVDHIGDDASDAAAEARRIGYVLVEGNPDTGTPIAATDDRIVESYDSSSPIAGDVVAVGAHVGVIMTAIPMTFSGTTVLVVAVVAAAAGAVAAKLLK